jgi:hypothetical protein
MPAIISLIRELKFELFKNILLLTFLKATIAFFIFDILKSFMDFSYVFSYVFAGLFFLFVLFREIKKLNIRIFEEHNPEIKEMLSTAADNLDKQNVVVEGLFEDVLERVKKVSSGTIIKPSTIFLLIISIPILAVINFELSPVRIDAISQDKLMEAVNKFGFVKNLFRPKTNVEGDIIEDELLDDDIYGDRSIATLGDKDVNIKMNLGFETDLTKPKDENKNDVAFTDFPETENVEVEYDSATYNDNIEESDLAVKYNEKIRGEIQ